MAKMRAVDAAVRIPKKEGVFVAFGVPRAASSYILRASRMCSLPTIPAATSRERAINYPFLFRHLDAIGYRGWVGCEYKPRTRQSTGSAGVRHRSSRPREETS